MRGKKVMALRGELTTVKFPKILDDFEKKFSNFSKTLVLVSKVDLESFDVTIDHLISIRGKISNEK